MIHYRNAVLQVSATQLGKDWVQGHVANMAAAAPPIAAVTPQAGPGASYKTGLIVATVLLGALGLSHVARRA